MYPIKLTEKHLDFLKKIIGKYDMIAIVEESVSNDNVMPKMIELDEQQFTSFQSMLIKIESQDGDAETKEFAKEWKMETFSLVENKFG